MVPKIAWVLAPLIAYGALLALAAARGRLPSRQSFNVQTSLLLMAYLLTTAGLGIFWVANQQLPVFDWHYLFGYCTVLLVSIHLWFNFPLAWRWLRGPKRAHASAAGDGLFKALVTAAALVAAFLLGTRQGGDTAAPLPAADAMVRYHELSSDSRRSVFARAPGIDWGAPPPMFKAYPGARHIALPRDEVGSTSLGEALRTVRPRMAPLRLAELGDILFLSAGVTAQRGGNALRAAPSSGALFSSELYVLAREVDGLPAGVYHYDPDQHRLDAIGPAPALADADATIVATSVFRRTGYKYRDRAYRYVTADTGHLLENLRLAGRAAGMQAEPVARFDEAQLARAVGVDGVEEGVLAAMALRRGEARAPAPRLVGTTAGAPGALGVRGAVQQATSLRLAADRDADNAIALPAPRPAAMPLRRAIGERRSQRRFHAGPVPLAALSAILAGMAQPPQLSDAVRIHIVVNRVDGLEPGVYRYLARHALERVRAGDFSAAAQSAALSQEVIGGAAVVLVLSAERAPMLGEGARGYRQGYLEAGMVGERWLLGAVAHGLAACPVGAFYDDEAAALIGVDPKRQWVLHFAALGLPAT
ncbi:SagB/ThcOx family dehydrogenase [Massilia sp. R2A-15]|uniref:SagB/ThcOx family dehydrogenase n=1 Tax=Massilia sp. R2A-15 TaxID=3064278 RepID=UPI002735629F|nr:SagB/ThcOx family dehydrogenase [Massilia sp. R2A-15]WLI89608.1 SagB/ThcOx family dehydrogenase [Massilia sp. R2A-15]